MPSRKKSEQRQAKIRMLPSKGEPSVKVVVTNLLPVVLELTKPQEPEAR